MLTFGLNYKTVGVGDFNADPPTRHGHLLKLFNLSNNFTLHIQAPTPITAKSATILDQIITNVPPSMKNTEALDPVYNYDHCPVRASVVLKNKYNKPKAF